MRYKRLGRTNLELSVISFGGLALFFQEAEKATALIEAALDEGINYIDCDEAGNQFVPALVYEDTRNKLGPVLKRRRNELKVGIKCMFAKKEDVARDIDKALEYIFKGTGKEKIDIFHLAHVDVDEKLDLLLSPAGGLAAVAEARQQGKLDHVLVASHNPKVLLRALKTDQFDVAEFPFTIIEQDYLKEVVPYCREHDIGTIAMKPLGGGQLTQRADLCIRWIMNYDVDIIIPGMKTMEELKQNIQPGHKYVPLSAEELRKQKQNQIGMAIGATLIFLLLIAFFVFLFVAPAETTARVRDIFIIVMAFESLLIGMVLVVLIVQIAKLTNLLQHEIKPILDSTNETVSTLRGTTQFLSDNLVEPVIKLNEYAAALRQLLTVLGLLRKQD